VRELNNKIAALERLGIPNEVKPFYIPFLDVGRPQSGK